MEITLIRDTGILVRGKETSCTVDVYGEDLPRLNPPLALITHYDTKKPLSSSSKLSVFDLPGEYEARGMVIRGIAATHDREGGNERGTLTIFQILFEGIKLGHLGHLGRPLSKEQLELLGDINILFLPVGGHDALSASEAIELINEIEPAIAVPLHVRTPGLPALTPLSDFLKKVGASAAEPQKKLSLKSVNPSEEGTDIVVLTPLLDT
ncbi:MAG: MBL fold metallo-hydrolase [Parcubacteria group bacterium]|nr:MBL fold metallo-hydrolase [Parcubacteria group bacterium]